MLYTIPAGFIYNLNRTLSEEQNKTINILKSVTRLLGGQEHVVFPRVKNTKE